MVTVTLKVKVSRCKGVCVMNVVMAAVSNRSIRTRQRKKAMILVTFEMGLGIKNNHGILRIPNIYRGNWRPDFLDVCHVTVGQMGSRAP